jgi:hypothetical protein
MKKMKFILMLALLVLSNFLLLSSQEIKQSTPLKPGAKTQIFKIGIYGGINIPISPPELVNKPTTATNEVQKSLLNGLNGLGFGTTYNIGIIAKYTLSEKFLLGANLDYSAWKSKNSCNCQGTDFGKSENSLANLHIGIFSHYFLYENLYAGPEFSLNIFDVKVTENSTRGNLDFSKSYTRIGAGITAGYEIPLSDLFTIDIFAKGLFPNLLANSSTNSVSESLIQSKNETTETKLFLISLNIGILYSL